VDNANGTTPNTSIGIYDNFFDLGGDSFQAIQLIQRVQKSFHIEIHLHHIIEAPTIASFSQLIETLSTKQEQGMQGEHSSLVVLKAEGKMHPFFCIHPAGGTVFCYRDLSRLLNLDIPMYALQSLAPSGGPEHTTIEESAAYYIEAIRQVQPHGPYFLGGLSSGGNVAFEMARQLFVQQEEVQLLALFDSHPPISYHGPAPTGTEFLAAFPWILAMYSGSHQPPPITYEDQHGARSLQDILRRVAEAGLPPFNMDLPQLRQFFHIWETHHHALRQYDPPAKSYPGSITLFRAVEEQPPGLLDLLKINLEGNLSLSGWEKLSTVPVQTYTAPGNHYTMLNNPYVQKLAKLVNTCIASLHSDDLGNARA
jgi:thioesterase domain-containing protein/acyl carrier protein